MPTTIHITDQGNQTISGIKTFATGIDIVRSTSPQSLRVFNSTGTNSGEFGLFGWQANQLIIGSQQSRSGLLRDITLTGRDININASGSLNIFDPVNISGNLIVSDTGIFNALNLNNIDNLNLSGVDITITSGNVILTNPISAPNLVYTTGYQIISGVKNFANSGIFSLSGAIPLSLPNNPLSVVGSGNTYIQVNIQNRATGTTATADLVITANNGTDSSNYINLGINNSGYNDPTFSNGSGLDGYLFINGGNLDIGTQTPNTNIEFHAGGTTSNRVIARINSDGLTIVSGNLTAQNTADQFPPTSGIRRYLIPSDYSTMGSSATPIRYTGEYVPFFLRKDITNLNLAVENTNGGGGILLQLAIYSGNNGLLNAPIAWSGSLSVGTTNNTIYRTNASINLNKGPYILGLMNTGTTSPSTTLRAANIFTANKVFGESTGFNTFGGATTATVRYYESGLSLPSRIGLMGIDPSTASSYTVMVGLEY